MAQGQPLEKEVRRDLEDSTEVKQTKRGQSVRSKMLIKTLAPFPPSHRLIRHINQEKRHLMCTIQGPPWNSIRICFQSQEDLVTTFPPGD